MVNQNTPTEMGNIRSVTIEEEMERSYLDYAMSVIVSRALPDLRDGLKPVHRRILYAMARAGWDHTKPFRKSARVVGDVVGQYHPHGTDPVYEAMVRLAQDFSMRLMLIEGQGNYGSVDGDPPAAMRYTEARLAKAASVLLADLDKETVDFRPTYDNTNVEPVVLPSRFPNLLVNGAGGIAVGMATNIPPHNLGEVIDACCAFLDNTDIDDEGLMDYIQGPDFPTGAIILGRSGISSAYRTGRGSIMMRARTNIEEIRKDRQAIIVTEIPYQVNKAKLVERIAECVRDKVIDGISDLRDESDRRGMRIVIEIKRDAMPEIVLNQLFRHTMLQTSFGANILAINNGRPEMLNLREIIRAFINFRIEVVTKRTRYDLNKARDRAHVLVGLVVAVANLDEVIELIKKAPDPQTAREQLMAKNWAAKDVEAYIQLIDDPLHKVINGKYTLSEAQARAILDLRLHRLTGLEREKLGGELKEIGGEIKEFLSILASHPKLLGIIREELLDVKEKFATPRLTSIEDNFEDQNEEDLIQPEDVVVTVSHAGYVKRVPLATYRAQRRGGKGRKGMETREEDFVSMVYVLNTHTTVLFFTSKGKVHQMKVYKLPEGSATSKGKAFINLLNLEPNETVTNMMPIPDDEAEWDKISVVFATSRGTIRRNALTDFTKINAKGKIAMKLEGTDRLISVLTCTEEDDIFFATKKGRAVRFPVADLRVFASRSSVGVRGLKIAAGDQLISMSIIGHVDATPAERMAYLKRIRTEMGLGGSDEIEYESDNGEDEVNLTDERYEELKSREQLILTLTDKGFGKRTSAYEYRTTNRGTMGIKNMTLSSKNGEVVASFPITADGQVVLVTDKGKLIRTPIDTVRICGRATQGVRIFKVDAGEKVVSVSAMEMDEEEGSEEGAAEE